MSEPRLSARDPLVLISEGPAVLGVRESFKASSRVIIRHGTVAPTMDRNAALVACTEGVEQPAGTVLAIDMTAGMATSTTVLAGIGIDQFWAAVDATGKHEDTMVWLTAPAGQCPRKGSPSSAPGTPASLKPLTI